MDTGRAALSFRSVDLEQLLQTFFRSNAERLDAAQINVEYSLSANAAELQADTDRLRQVFSNLLSNTLLYTTTPGRLRFSTRRDGKGIQILWEDSAPEGPPSRIIPCCLSGYIAASARAIAPPAEVVWGFRYAKPLSKRIMAALRRARQNLAGSVCRYGSLCPASH